MKRAHSTEPEASSLRHTMLSVIVPAYNEQEVIQEFHNRLCVALESADVDSVEILYVNDGSTDQTLLLLLEIMNRDNRVQVIDLSRNFGKEAAMTAGFDTVKGQATIVIDADLQDPPELIPQMVSEWHNGYDVVLMRRSIRRGESWLKKSTAKLFYYTLRNISQTHIPENVGDFRLLSRRAVTALRQLPERTRFMKGLFAWIGFPTTEIYYHRDPRYSGVTKWNYWNLWNFALEGITSFTIAPLKVASYVGGTTAFCSLAYGFFVLIKAIFWGDPVPGYPSLMVTVLFLGGLQLLAIGVVGEYLGRMFLEVKQRPIYLVNKHHRPSEITPSEITDYSLGFQKQKTRL
jgi:polyisoprenyl-phosphate glycosyltransferase